MKRKITYCIAGVVLIIALAVMCNQADAIAEHDADLIESIANTR